MPVEIGSLSTEVVPETEAAPPAEDRRWQVAERLKRHTERLRRLELRTRAEGRDD